MSQEFTQTVRGVVLDKDVQTPLEGAHVVVLNTDPEINALTDEKGSFKLVNVPIGRIDIAIFYVGYEEKTVPNVLVGSGKEVVLTINLTESVSTLKHTVVNAKRNRNTRVLNDMVVASARSFSVEQTKRYAGAIDDPARMVSAFAGVNGNAEGNNDIVVRGNSSKGVLWRLEGIEIPNPNHFAGEGATGGPINALNSSMLGNSDFYSGAFSADYGNALSGVFDMHLRRGNNQKREYSATASILGTDVTLEGPFKEGYRGSYLVNYRYSTLAMLDDAGIVDFGGVPKYQDGSFNIHLPAGDKHTFSLFGLGGLSSIDQVSTEEDNDSIILSSGVAKAKLGVAGLSHTYLINKKTYLKTTLSANGTVMENTYNIPDDEGELYTVNRSEFTKTNLSAQTVLRYKLNAQNTFKSGLIFSRLGYAMKDDYWSFQTDRLEPRLDEDGSANRLQAFVNWKHRITADVTMVTGLHYLRFMYNDNHSFEPRMAFRWQQNKRQAFSLGTGIHSRLESIATYIAQEQQTDGSFIQHNRDLDLSKAAHFVLGYDRQLNQLTNIKIETYYQHLFNVPVENVEGSSYSLLNSSGWFTTRNMVNEGKGRNYGVEFTLERSFQNNFYYMSTMSLYKSQYTAMDGIERNTAFDGNYVVNFLGGKEFAIGKPEKKKVLFVNSKLALIGGSRYTPILLDESIALGDVVRDEQNPFSMKGDDVFKLDIAIGIRRNRVKTTTELKLDIQNVSNNSARVNEYYDHATESIVYGNQLPLLPVLSYKVNF
jgi:hypothetical protein